MSADLNQKLLRYLKRQGPGTHSVRKLARKLKCTHKQITNAAEDLQSLGEDVDLLVGVRTASGHAFHKDPADYEVEYYGEKQ